MSHPSLKPRRLLLAAALAATLTGAAQGATLTYTFDLGGGLTGWGSFDDANLANAGGGFWTSPILQFFFPYDGFTYTETHDPLGLAWLANPIPSFVGFEYQADQNGNQVIFVAGTDPSGSDWGGVDISGNTPLGFTPLNSGNTQPGGGPAAVPEPETWIASLLSLGLMLLARRRRRGDQGG